MLYMGHSGFRVHPFLMPLQGCIIVKGGVKRGQLQPAPSPPKVQYYTPVVWPRCCAGCPDFWEQLWV
jgi:hypothetical protein